MTCNQTRIAISALIDGEDPGIPAAQARAHLAGCAACRAWQQDAEEVTRAVRVHAVDVPDLTEQVLAAVAADPQVAARNTAAAIQARRQVLRWALAASAVAQLLLGLPLLFSGVGDTVHVSREMASFDVAIAVGYLFAVWRPARAAALVPVAVALSICLLVTSTLDVANDGAVVAHEVGHLLAVLQAGLLWALGRTGPRSTPLPAAGSVRRVA
jgi:predicted anti-sigma-YlaC factor YlaD